MMEVAQAEKIEFESPAVTDMKTSPLFKGTIPVAQRLTPTLLAALLTPLLLLVLLGNSVQAANIWDGGSGTDANWDTADNWDNNTVPLTTVTVTFGTGFGSGTAVNLNGNRTVDSLTINSITDFSLNNNTLTLSSGDITRSAASGTTTINSAIALGGAAAWNIEGNLVATGIIEDNAGTFALTKTGTGTLTLSGNNGFDGATTVSTGTLVLGHDNAAGSGALNLATGTTIEGSAGLRIIANAFDITGAASGTVTFGGTDLRFTDAFDPGAAYVYAVNNTTEFTGAITGNNAFTKTGTGTLILSGANANNLATVTVNSGTLRLSKNAGVNAVDDNLTIGDGTGTDTVQLTAANQIGNASAVTINSSGVLDLNGNAETIGSLAGSAGASVTLGAATLTAGDANSTAYAGTISGTGGLTKQGAGTLTLSGANTYSGVTTVSAGVLRLDHASALPGGIDTTVGAGESALTLSGGVVGLGTGDFTRALGTGAGQVQFTGSGGFAAYGANRSVNLDGNETPSSLTWNSTASFLTAGTLILGAADADATVDFKNPLNLNTATRTVQVDDGSAAVDAVLSGQITGTGASLLTKTGSGALSLTGNNSHAGGLTVSAGTIIFGHNSAAGSGNLTLAGGVTVQGTDGSRTIDNNLVVNGNLTFSGSESLEFTDDFDQNNNRIYTVDNTTTFSGDIIGGNTLTKSGTGTLILSGNNTIAGVTVNTGGALRVANDGALGAATGGVTVNSGGALELTGGRAIGAEALSLNGTGVGNGGALRNVSGNNTWGGLVTLVTDSRINSDSGTLIIDVASGNAIAGGSGDDLTVGGSGNVTVNDAMGLASNATLTKDGSGTLTLNGSSPHGGATTISAGVIRAGNSSSFGTTAGGVSVVSGAAVELTGGISVGAEALSLSGSGVSSGGALRNISSDNSWAGAVTLGSATRINSDSGTLTVSGGINGAGNALTVGGAGNVTVSTTGISGSGTSLTKDGDGTLNMNVASTYTGGTTLSQGTLKLGADNVMPNSGTFEFAGGLLDANNMTDTLGALSLTANSTLNLGDATARQDLTFSSANTWTAGTLTITGWDGPSGVTYDRLFITADPTGSGILDHIQFSGYGLGAVWGVGGEITPVPEPIHYALGIFGLVFVGLRAGRHYLARRRTA